MRTQLLISMLALAVTLPALAAAEQPAGSQHLNPVIDLLHHKQSVFGLYGPNNRRPGSSAAQKSPLELARETLAYPLSDYIFDGSMEHGFEQGYPSFVAYAKALHEVAPASRTPVPRLKFPLAVKVNEIAPDPAQAASNIGKQLDAGVTSVIFVDVQSAEEVKQGIAAMRFKENGGTRTTVGDAPTLWGMSEQEYRQKADVWPLNPQGELVAQVIVESKEGLKHLREIAAVKGIGVLWPGAGTLRGVFSALGPDGKRVLDEAAWEASIQQVLTTCKEFKIACGYPANEHDIELRIRQGFSVFIIGWGEAGFRAVDLGRKASNRQPTGE